jgi:hypothetical protein
MTVFVKNRTANTEYKENRKEKLLNNQWKNSLARILMIITTKELEKVRRKNLTMVKLRIKREKIWKKIMKKILTEFLAGLMLHLLSRNM